MPSKVTLHESPAIIGYENKTNDGIHVTVSVQTIIGADVFCTVHGNIPKLIPGTYLILSEEEAERVKHLLSLAAGAGMSWGLSHSEFDLHKLDEYKAELTTLLGGE